jgi:hypothetical protein
MNLRRLNVVVFGKLIILQTDVRAQTNEENSSTWPCCCCCCCCLHIDFGQERLLPDHWDKLSVQEQRFATELKLDN